MTFPGLLTFTLSFDFSIRWNHAIFRVFRRPISSSIPAQTWSQASSTIDYDYDHDLRLNDRRMPNRNSSLPYGRVVDNRKGNIDLQIWHITFRQSLRQRETNSLHRNHNRDRKSTKLTSKLTTKFRRNSSVSGPPPPHSASSHPRPSAFIRGSFSLCPGEPGSWRDTLLPLPIRCNNSPFRRLAVSSSSPSLPIRLHPRHPR